MNGVAKNIIVGAIITAGVAGMIAALSNKQTRDKIARGIKRGIDEVQRKADHAEDSAKETYEEAKRRYENAKARMEEKDRATQ